MVVVNLVNSFNPVPKKAKKEKKANFSKIKQRRNTLTKMENIRFSILTNNFEHCYLCNSILNIYNKLNKHEIFFGTANRKNSMKYGLIVPLCNKCHTVDNLAVHNNYFTDLKLKQLAQKKFEETYTREDFLKIFGKNYLLGGKEYE